MKTLAFLFAVVGLSACNAITIPVPDRYRKDKPPQEPVTPAPVKPTATPVPTRTVFPPTPTPIPTKQGQIIDLPAKVKVGEPFKVRAWIPEKQMIEMWAEKRFRLGTMGWDRYCPCKSLTVTFNTAGTREIWLKAGEAWVISEKILVEP